MSAKITGMIFESTLPPSQRLVLLALADRGSADGRNIYPSIIEVAGMTGLSGRHVKRVMHQMKDAGIILVESQAGYHSPNRYRINLTKLDKQARVIPLRVIPDFTPEQKSKLADAEEVYALYPKKAERQHALRAIIKALKSNPKDYLIERTKLYADTVNGCAREFIPYPQKWFNRERFKETPAEWAIKERDGSTNRLEDELKRLKNRTSWTDEQRARIHELQKLVGHQ